MDMNNVFAGVNWQDVQPASGGREVFEEGWTQVIIADSKGAENSGKTGFGLTLYLKAISGPNKDRTIDDFINVFHKTAQAQEIGQRQFSAYCHSVGEFKPVDNHASNMRNKPFWVRTVIVEEEYTPEGKTEAVKTRKSKVKDWDTNNGTKHGSAGGNGTATAAPPPSTPAPAPVQANGAAPSSGPAAEWGPPPPGAGEAAPASSGGAPWGSGSGTPAPAASGGAPWGSAD